MTKVSIYFNVNTVSSRSAFSTLPHNLSEFVQGLKKKESAIVSIPAEFIKEPLSVDEFSWSVTKAPIDPMIDCQWICPKADAVTFHYF